MWGVSGNPSQASQLSTKKEQKQVRGRGLAESFRPENFIPGLIIGFTFGLLLDLTTPFKGSSKKNFLPGKSQQELSVSSNGGQELKLVLVVRRPENGCWKNCISMCPCSHWHVCRAGAWLQPPFAFETMGSRNKIREGAESLGLPTFVVADAGRTQVASGSKTVLAVGPGDYGNKSY